MLRALTTFRFAAAVCMLMPLLADAAGLGRLTVQSSLGQPLRAEVALVSVQPGEESNLVARIAPPDAFQAAGIEFTSTMVNLRVAVDRRDGRPVLRLSSAQPVNEPFLEVLIELQWATGRLVRQYTFLLDPAEYKPPRPAVAPPAPAPAPKAKPAPEAPKAAKPAAVTPPKARTYEIQKGDTLSKVARETRPADVTVNQMLVALFQANESAFIRDNMFLMRTGHILKIPERTAIAAISRTEATRTVRSHGVDFDEYRRGLAASVATAPAKPTPPAEREAPGRIAPKPVEPAAKQPKDQIKLSRVDTGKPAAPATRAAVGDDKAALNRALQESQSRVTDLEKQIADLKKLIELKNQQLALLEQKAAGKPAAVAPVPAAPKPGAAPAKPAAPIQPAKPAPEAPKPAAPAPVPAPKPAAAAAPKAPPAVAKPKPVPPPPPPEVSLIDEFLDNPVALGGLGGVLVLLIGYGAWAWRRKKTAQAREGGFASIAAAPQAPSAEAIQPAVPAAVAAAAAAGEPAGALEEVDPIAEADVYLAYGRDAQAETILTDALASDPNRLNVHAKLLDIYAQRKDKSAFERTALKVKGISGGSGPEWEKAMSLGRAIDPGNGLYGSAPAGGGEASTAPAAPSASPDLDFDIGGTTSPGASAEPAAPAAVDFDIDKVAGSEETSGGFKPGDTVVMSAKEMEAQAPRLDLDIGATTQESVAAKMPAAKPEAAPEPAALDFDLDFDLGESKPAESAPAAAAVDPKWQEVATKLDLAKAYQEMGDKNGARELLEEVVNEGDAAQQEEAKRVLEKLG